MITDCMACFMPKHLIIYNKDLILKSMQDEKGVVRVVLCTVALGRGVNVAGLNYYHSLWSTEKH